MYSTAKDIHIGIISKLYQINSNRKGNFRPEEIDEAFNNSMFKFIEERSIVNPSDVGLDETVKRQDDLKDLKVYNKFAKIMYTQSTFADEFKNVNVILPVDYYKFESLELAINYDCHRIDSEVTTKSFTKFIYQLKFDTPSSSDKYDSFVIKKGTTSIYTTVLENLQNFKNVASKFIIINSVLEVLNRDLHANIEIYWETFGNIYKRNSFIIVSNLPGESYSLTIDSSVVTSTNVTNEYEEFDYYDDISGKAIYTNVVPTDLKTAKDFANIRGNYYMYKNRYKKPLIQINNGVIGIDYNPQYIPMGAFISYIKKPILLNLKSDIMTDFKSHITEIIDLTVTTLSLILNGSEQALNNISTKNQL